MFVGLIRDGDSGINDVFTSSRVAHIVREMVSRLDTLSEQLNDFGHMNTAMILDTDKKAVVVTLVKYDDRTYNLEESHKVEDDYFHGLRHYIDPAFGESKIFGEWRF